MSAASRLHIRALDPTEVPALAALEAASWPDALQASEATIRRRLGLGHRMLVALLEGTIIGALCSVSTSEEPFDPARFPRDFTAFSSLPRSAPVRSSYYYSFCVHPRHRGGEAVTRLLAAGIAASRAEGARWLVGDGRCPAYAGGQEGPDKVRPDPAFRAAIDRWAATGERPATELLLRDPVLRFYHRRLGAEFLHLAPGFLPGDAASGGYRVIFAADLQRARVPA